MVGLLDDQAKLLAENPCVGELFDLLVVIYLQGFVVDVFVNVLLFRHHVVVVVVLQDDAVADVASHQPLVVLDVFRHQHVVVVLR